jgi:ring-1,2-phenylacetyl-CoA epoxidase subunit PaaC
MVLGERGGGGRRLDYVLRIADTNLVLAQRLGEWIGHAPVLEEELALANVSLDLLGQARFLLSYAGELEGRGRDEDALAFLRTEAEFRNVQLAEQPNGDFACTIVRQVLLDAYQAVLYERLQRSSDGRLAGIATTALRETRYHLRYSGGWLVRLGDGTEESHRRAQAALDLLWPYTRELFDADEVDREMRALGIGPDPAEIGAAWRERTAAVFAEAMLRRPADSAYAWYGKRGQHSEHLGHLLTAMQYMQRAYPGARW